MFTRPFGRLAALAKTHNLLNQTFWRGASLRDLVKQALAPHALGGQAVVAGEGVRLGPIAAVTLDMALDHVSAH